MSISEFDVWYMTRALELARAGQGTVEPNPMVGCVIAAGDEVVGEGWHRKFGGPHAEVEALAVAGSRAVGATMYVTLEPCCHHGKTPPCTDAIQRAGVRRVVAAMEDPFAEVSGGGLAALRSAGVAVEVGLLSDEARRLNAPYLKLLTQGRPWVIAKWAMTLDGKIATRTGASRWISSEASRLLVHRLRGRMDGILIGAGTAERDDPLLTARPPGQRTAVRIVVDSRGALPLQSRLVRSAPQVPLWVAVGPEASAAACAGLRAAGCEVLVCAGEDHRTRLSELLDELGRRRVTNLLVEGGGRLLGSLFDAGQIDELHAFIAPRLFGGEQAPGPLAGIGVALPTESARLSEMELTSTGGDIYLRGRISR